MSVQCNNELSATLKVVNYIFTLFALRNPFVNSLATNFRKIIFKLLKTKTIHIEPVPDDYFIEIVGDRRNFPGDERSCALLSDQTFYEFFQNSEYGWLEASSRFKGPSRFIQCLKCPEKLENDILYVTEETGFNILETIGSTGNTISVFAANLIPDFYPDLAKSVKLAPIFSDQELSPEEESEALHTFFSSPKYLLKNDLLKCSSRRKLWFQVVEILSEQNTPNGFGNFVLKDNCELYSIAPIASFLPPKKCFKVKNSKKLLSVVPGGLTTYFEELLSISKPFLSLKNLDISSLFLLSGAAGSGRKTCLKALSDVLGLHLLFYDCYDFYGLGFSAAEGKYSQLLARVLKLGPCLLVLTSFELLGKTKANEEDPRLIGSFFEQLKQLFAEKKFPALVFALTNDNPDDLPGIVLKNFLKVIRFTVIPSEDVLSALKSYLEELNLAADESDMDEIKKRVVGYHFADIRLLVRHARRFSLEENVERGILRLEHFQKALDLMESAYSDTIGAAKVPNVKWDDIGGLANLKEEIMFTLKPAMINSSLKRSGILLYGPPGTGKTLMAKAVATECGMNFLSVKGPELMNMYVGQSERNVREVFERGRQAAPCVLFFDELDSLAPARGLSQSGVTDRVVSQLLAEMDGMDANQGLFLIAATNRPDLVDGALLRPGRFGQMFYLGICGCGEGALGVLKALTKRFLFDDDVDLIEISEKLPENVTGADLYSLCSNAWLNSARRCIGLINEGTKTSLPLKVNHDDFHQALNQLVPSLSEEDLTYYKNMCRNVFSRSAVV